MADLHRVGLLTVQVECLTGKFKGVVSEVVLVWVFFSCMLS